MKKKNIEFYNLFNLTKENHTCSQGWGSKRSSIKTARFQTGPRAKTAHINQSVENAGVAFVKAAKERNDNLKQYTNNII